MLSRLRRRVAEPSAALPGAIQSRLMGCSCLPSTAARGAVKTPVTAWLLVIGVLSAGLWREASAQGFAPKTDFATGTQPRSVAIGDVNGDGRPDLAVANYISSTVSVLLGTGTGGFGAKTDFATGTQPYSVAIGDVSGDGRPDLAVANAASSTVSVLLGTGAGGFGAKTDFATGTSPRSVAIGDVSGDGRPDLAVANDASSTVSVLLGNGAGGFGAKTDFATGSAPYSVAIGDVSGDGRPDLVVANLASSTVSVLLGTGAGGFGAKTDFATGSFPISVAIGDVSVDGRPDLAVANANSNTVSVLLGNGAGGFGAKTDFATGSSPYSVAIGDLNGDSKPDLAVANFSDNTVSALLGTGAGGFGAKTDFATGTEPYSVAIGDLNGNGRPDLAVANVGANTVSVLLNTYPPPPRVFGPKVDYAIGTLANGIAVGDLNGDSKPDLVSADGDFSKVSVLLGTGAGIFGPKTNFTTGTGGPTSAAIADLNADGNPDLAVTMWGSNTVGVLLGTGTGSFGPFTEFTTGGFPFSVAVGDLNGDGKPDLAAADQNSSTVSVLLGTGGGSFGLKTDFVTGNTPRSVAIGDLNGDGKLDLATANSLGNTVSVLLGTGSGSFGAKTDFTTGTGPRSVAIGDLNGDSNPDLAVANENSNTVSVLLGTGGGSFGAKTDFATGTSPRSVVIGDLDNDGKLDLAAANFSSNKVSVLLGTGSGSFGAKTDFPTGSAPNAVAIADLNGDGWRDLAVLAQGSNKISVLLNTIDTASPTVHLNAPNGGGTIIMGSVTNITWTASDDYVVDHVDLYYSLDGGTNYTLIVANRPNSGSYGWSVPTTATGSGRVKVVAFDGSGHSAEDASDANFNIQPTISINDVSVAEPNAGTTSVAFTVSLSNPSSQPITVNYQTQDGTATLANNDYVYASGTVSIPANVPSATLTVLVNGDLVYEPEETFTVALSNPVNGSLIDASGQCTITSLSGILEGLYVTNGSVEAAAVSGNTLYIGGNFSRVGPATGGAVPIDASSGLPVAGFPKVVGTVQTIVSDGAGGWYLGGTFTWVGGQARSNLAHIEANLAVSPWAPSANNTVNAIAVSGGTVYVGGTFTSVGGQPRNYLAELSAASGLATAWNPNPNASVTALAVNGGIVYAAGTFNMIGSTFRGLAAAVDATTGLATAWDPSPNSTVRTLIVSGSTVYVGGDFSSVGGQVRSRIAAVDATTGLATAWDPNASGVVFAMALSGATLYVGGQFTTVGGQARNRIAALSTATGNATSWNPDASGGMFAVFSLGVGATTVYAGGLFQTIGGQSRNFFAAVDATTGLATAWNPNPTAPVTTLAVNGTTVYAAGNFNSLGGQARSNLAALDLATGLPTSWNPSATGGDVTSLLVVGPLVYVGGSFASMGGVTHGSVAAVDAGTGVATSWDPSVSSASVRYVSALAVSGSTVYLGGSFSGAGGAVRSNIAAVDATTGLATSWSPNANGFVRAMVVSGPNLYLGGSFSTVDGQARGRIAAVDLATGVPTAWSPDASGGPADVTAMVPSPGGGLYAGGKFTSIGGHVRNGIAELDLSTGLATAWNPAASFAQVFGLATLGNTVYVGGLFSTIGGQARNNFAALDAASGLALGLDPSPNNMVQCIVATELIVALGGSFSSAGALPQSNLVGIGTAEQPPVVSINDVTVTEGAAGTSIANLTIGLSNLTAYPVTVHYQTQDGTATLANADYVAASGTATVDPKTLSVTLPIQVNGDTKHEADESLTVTISSPTNATLGRATGQVTILNDDGAPGLSINDVTIAEGDTGSVSVVFTVKLSHPTDQPVRALFHTEDGSATVADSDYVAVSDTVVIAAKSDSATIAVSVTGDLAHEPVETFSVVLSDPVNATIGDSAGIGTIANDDPDTTPPAIPTPFTGLFSGGPVQLHWGANTEPDFALYHLHRDTTEDFVPGPGNLVVSQPDTGYVDAGSTWSYYKLSALDSTGNQSGFALLVPSSQAAGATFVGSNVPVSLPPVHLTFQNVTSGGVTTLTTQTGGQAPPNGLKVAPGSPKIYYQLTTTASFTGTVTVCITYDPAHVSGQESNLKLMHFDTAQMPPKWMELISSVNVDSNVICGTVTHFSEFALMETDPTVDVKDGIPSTVQLYPCVPNPVSGTALIRFDLPVVAAVRLGLFDLQGRRVRDLERATKGPGRYTVQWDGRGDHGERLKAGIYFLRLEAGAFRQVRRVALIN
jgi:hypothetical protein